MPVVDLIYDLDCPNVAAARSNLMRAFSRADVTARWQEHRIGDPDAPEQVRGFGSPTILVDGHDVADAAPGDAACCRVYDGGRAPSVAVIARALGASARAARPAARSGRVRSGLAAVPGIGAALMPKLACPLCWPAYAAVLGALGLGFLMQSRWLLPISAALLALALAAIAWRAPARRGYGPLWVALTGATAILAGKFALDASAIADAGVAAFVSASVWNAWPRRRKSACAACEPVSHGRKEETWQSES